MNIKGTFYENTYTETGGKSPGNTFISVCDRSLSCPPSIIATVAENAPGITLPDGYTQDMLKTIKWTTGYYDQPTPMSYRQGCELKEIGEQIIALNEQGMVEPPLTVSERLSILHLIVTVGKVQGREGQLADNS